jgi:hypothetical protein
MKRTKSKIIKCKANLCLVQGRAVNHRDEKSLDKIPNKRPLAKLSKTLIEE